MITEDFAGYAARVRMAFPSLMPPDTLQSMLESFMSGVAMDCLESGTRLIGHIKSMVESGEDIIACSVTDHDGRVRCRGRFERPQQNLDVIINVLQYGLSKKELVRIVANSARSSFTGLSSIQIEDLEVEEKEIIRLG